MEDPLPCRFCNQLPKQGKSIISDRVYVRYSCLDCHADSFPHETLDEAREDWNKRHGRQISDEPVQ